MPGAWVSRMHTAAPVFDQHVVRSRHASPKSILLLAVPLPRNMASRPVECIAATMDEGAAVPLIDTSCVFKSALTELMPCKLYSEEETSLMHDSQVIGTLKIV